MLLYGIHGIHLGVRFNPHGNAVLLSRFGTLRGSYPRMVGVHLATSTGVADVLSGIKVDRKYVSFCRFRSVSESASPNATELLNNFPRSRFGGFYLSFGYLIDPKNAVAASLAAEYVPIPSAFWFDHEGITFLILLSHYLT